MCINIEREISTKKITRNTEILVRKEKTRRISRDGFRFNSIFLLDRKTLLRSKLWVA